MDGERNGLEEAERMTEIGGRGSVTEGDGNTHTQAGKEMNPKKVRDRKETKRAGQWGASREAGGVKAERQETGQGCEG